MTCDRCGRETSAWTGSIFNTERICFSCSTPDAGEGVVPGPDGLGLAPTRLVVVGVPLLGLPSGYAEWAAARR